MTDHEPATSAEVASQSPPSATADTTATTADEWPESPPANDSVKESESATSPKTEDAWPEEEDGWPAAPPSANGKEFKESKDPKQPRTTAKGKNGKNFKERPGKSNEKDKDIQGEGKPKKEKVEPYVNEDRVKTGGTPREKLSPEELAARMERIRLNNEKIKERRAAVQADERAFQESQAVVRARQAEQRKIQATIDEKRAAVAKRKMEKAGVREWDSFKKTPTSPNAHVGGEGGTNASMHAPKPADVSVTTDAANANESANKAKDAWPAHEPQSPGGGVEGERGRGRGRGAGRARGRGRGARGRGEGSRGGRGGPFCETRREKAPHIKDTPQDSSQDSNAADGGAAADEWGTAAEGDMIQTGIAITTSEEDLWGAPGGEDPWGSAQKS